MMKRKNTQFKFLTQGWMSSADKIVAFSGVKGIIILESFII